jgi:23S rRNA pseudouridine1911/1915/1917 synthase
MDPLPPEAFVEIPFVVEANYQGWRLDRYLCEKIPRLSRMKVQHLIREALRSDVPLKPSTPVKAGLHFWLRRPALVEPPTTDDPVRVIWEDDDLLIVDKPAGLPMHPTARYFKGTLVARLREMTRPGDKLDPAHRLDRETSGLVLCGKKPRITGKLKMAFAAARVKKAYLAIVEGDPPFESIAVDAPLSVGSDVVRIKVEVDRVAGKPAVTDFQVTPTSR